MKWLMWKGVSKISKIKCNSSGRLWWTNEDFFNREEIKKSISRFNALLDNLKESE